jgi:hypothetical protein
MYQLTRPTPHWETWGGYFYTRLLSWPSPFWHSHPLHNLPLLGIRYPRGVKPIGQLIGGPCGVMPNKCCSEVLWDACALTLGDEPLASAVEHRANA